MRWFLRKFSPKRCVKFAWFFRTCETWKNVCDQMPKHKTRNTFYWITCEVNALADLLTVVSDRIARAFSRSGATGAVALDISKGFDRIWHAGLHELKSYGISSQIFDLISSFLSNRRLWVVLNGKSSQEYPVNAEVSQEAIHGLSLFLL